MPVVYVHGIANRESGGVTPAGRMRDRLFEEHLLPGLGHGPHESGAIEPAVWGHLAGRLRWNGRSLPVEDMTPLGSGGLEDDILDLLAQQQGGSLEPRRLLLDIARTSPEDAVDLLFSLVVGEDGELTVEQKGRLATGLVRYCASLPEGGGPPEWQRKGLDNDDAFLARLREASAPWTPPLDTSPRERAAPGGGPGKIRGSGVWDRIGYRLRGLRRRMVSSTQRPASRVLHRTARRVVPRYVGDVTAYLAQRGTPGNPGPIVRAVGDAVERAAAGRRDGRRLAVVAHSMGGNIVYDLLTHFRPSLEVDVLVTVGSQVGLFEELKLFGASDHGLTGDRGSRVPKPPGVRRWINVVDFNDPLAFRAEPVFEGAEDYRYPTGALWAHTAYLVQPHFHARLAARLDGDPR
ncbi:hypothetical protein [Streptomyces sp. JJ38]|uniref:hypothetical protein n=1 Tax=Streptomyces sp. JJ38 TaxID=2738128 RepID=UPI001C55F5FB|nr:hypothetical protein [Streptomyces sp. JJ38]MBW1596710.1 hypothetical protein [Streptomyces sp. JJ38]